MSFKLINVGSGRLAEDGECIRDAFVKVNDNFQSLFAVAGLEQLIITVDVNNNLVVTNQISIVNDVDVSVMQITEISNDVNINVENNLEIDIANNLDLTINNNGITLITDNSNNVVLTSNSFTSNGPIYTTSITNTANTNNITFNANDIDITNTSGDINIDASTNNVNFTGDIVLNTNMFEVNVTTGDINIQTGAITIDNSQEVNINNALTIDASNNIDIGINNTINIDASQNITFAPSTNIDFSNVVNINGLAIGDIEGTVDTLQELSDTNIFAPGHGEFLMWDSTEQKWQPSLTFPTTTEFFVPPIMRGSISYYASSFKYFTGIEENGTIVLRNGPFADSGAAVHWIEQVDNNFQVNITDLDVNNNRYIETRVIVNNNYIAPETENAIIITGKRSDPSFAPDKTYILRTGDGSEYTYGPTTDEDRNFFTGITALNIPGLTISFGADDPYYTNPTRITYIPQYEGDTLELVEPADIEATPSGWDHLLMTERVYSIADGDIGGYRSPGVVLTGIQFSNTPVDIQWLGGTAPTGGTGRFDVYDIGFYYTGSAFGRQCFIKHSTTDSLEVQGVQGDLTGSVFADDSTLLVDAVNGTIPGYIAVTDLKTIAAGAATYEEFQTAIAAL